MNKNRSRTFSTLCLIKLCLILGGCATGVSNFTGPDGKQSYALKCSGYMRDWDDCYKSAGELCPSGYDVIDQQSGHKGYVATGSVLANVQSQHLMVQCR